MHDVAVLDNVIRPFEAHAAGVLRALLPAISNKIDIGDRLGADEAFFEIGVNAARRLRRLCSSLDRRAHV